MKQLRNALRSLFTLVGFLCVASLLLTSVVPSLGLELPVAASNDAPSVTVVSVSSVLNDIGELAVAEWDYTGYCNRTEHRYVFGFAAPGTYNRVSFSYTGAIKAGYEVARIKVSVHDKVICITLPEPKVFSNTAHVVGTVEARKNFLNPFDGTEVDAMLAEAEAAELDKAISGGLYDRAASHARLVIQEALMCFVRDGYELRFIN